MNGILHCRCDLHFPDGRWYQTHVHILVSYLYFFDKMSIQIIVHLLTGWFAFFLLNCLSSLYTLDLNCLSDEWLTNIYFIPLCWVFLWCGIFIVLFIQFPRVYFWCVYFSIIKGHCEQLYMNSMDDKVWIHKQNIPQWVMEK